MEIDGKLSYSALFLPARVEGQEIELRLHMGARFCQLWPRVAERLGVPFGQNVERVRQLTATVPVIFGPRPITIALAPGIESKVAFTSHYDSMTSQIRLDGILGHNFLARYRAMIDRDGARLWLAPRADDLGVAARDRFARWGDAFTACAVPGCVETVLIPGEEGAPQGLMVRRAAGMTVGGFEAVLEALDAAGKPLAGPLLRVSFDAGTRDIHVADPRFAALVQSAAAFRVVELSPHPARCPPGGCVEPLDRLPR
jgi:hypothetical protein